MRTKSFLLSLFIIGILSLSNAQNDASLENLDASALENGIYPVSIDVDQIFKRLDSKSGTIELPFLQFTKNFIVQEFSIYGTAKNPYPEIRTFKIFDNDDSRITGRITIGPSGINVIYLLDGQMIRIYNPTPTKQSDIQYVQEIGINKTDKILHKCDTHDDFSGLTDSYPSHDDNKSAKSNAKRNGSIKRIYRAAIICTGEYFVNNGGGATTIGQLIISNLNDISAIFEKDLAVEMVMASGSPRLNQDIDTDPFDPSFGGRTQQAQDAVESAFALNRYDVGHVFHNHQSGDGWDTGGVAGLGVICNSSRKGSGWSGSFNNTSNGWIQLAAHEFGHMYNATHTFNGSGDANCTPNISQVSGYEIGSGTTLMSYNGLCDAEQNIPGSGIPDNYFHANSLDRMVSYLEDFGVCNEVDWIIDNNNEPVAEANSCDAVLVMPRLTPFMLKGKGTDPDGDMLTYCWEQYDEDGPNSTATSGLIGNDAANNNVCPLYRSYPPTPDPIRYFPNLADLSNNVNSDFEVLTRRQRAIKFRLTVRDNNPNGGAIDWEEIQVNTRNSGPLSVITPSLGQIVQAGSVMEVTWNVNGSEDLCDKAIIRLSTDGGLSFPLTLAKDIDYDAGSAMVNVPSSFPNTDAARIMVACDDYECFAFFDINNSNFVIESNCLSPANVLCDTEEEVFDFGDPGLNLGLNAIQGTNISSILGPIGTGLGTMFPAVNNASGTCTRINSINNPFLAIPFSVTATGNYVFTINNNISDNVTAYTIFTANDFDPIDACSSFIESNANFINGSYTFSTSLNVFLEACTEYIIAAQVTNSSSQNLAISSIQGPGNVIRAEDISDYDLTFLAIDLNTDIIVQQSPNSDFRTLPVGEYSIVSNYYKSRGATPPANADPENWVGLTVTELLGGLDCFRSSNNEKLITVNQSCFVMNIVPGNQTACAPETNTYDQTISFDIDMGPGTGTVEINGQVFDVTGDQMTVTLTDLVANGRPVDLNFVFSGDSGCDGFYEDVFVSAMNCCPIEVDLGPDAIYCEGDNVQLDAGDEAIAYQWFRNGIELNEQERFLNATVAGNYQVQVTHPSGCINDDDINISFENLPVIEFDTDEILSCDGLLEVVNAFITVNSGEIEWQRNGMTLPNTGSSIEVTEDGNYEIFVTTDNNCVSSLSFEATFEESPEVDLGEDRLSCTGSTITIDAGETDATFAWRRNAFPISGTESTLDVTTFGTYSVIVTFDNGCVGHDTVNVDFKPLPEFDFGRDVTRCFGNFYTIEAEVSSFDIEWLLNGEIIPDENEINYTATSSGEYVGQISLNEQCFESDTIVVTYLDVPNVDLPDILSACPGELVQLIVDDPNAVFTWASESAGVLPETSGTLTITNADTYYLTARSTSTFCIVRDTVVVNFTDIPLIDLGSDLTGCEGDILSIGSPTEGFVAEWYKDGVLIDGEDGEELLVSESGEYRMVISSGSECFTEDFITVSFFETPVVELGTDVTSCPGETIILDAGSGTNEYEWSKDGMPLSEDSNLLSVQETGLYSVIVTNANDCSSTDQLSIIFTELPNLNLGSDVENCAGDIVMLDADAEGFTIEWFIDGILVPNNTTSVIEAQGSGQYHVVVSAGSNCSVSDTVNVNYVDLPIVDLGDDIDACPGDEIQFEIEDNGNTFSWSGQTQGAISNNTNTLDVVISDTYFVEVTNSSNCTTLDTVTVTFVDLPILNLGEDQDLCEGDPFELGIQSNGFNIVWFKDDVEIPDVTGELLEITSSGTYKVEVSANDDCKTSDEVVINFNSIPQVDLGVDRSACPGDEIVLTGGDQSDIHVWSSGSQGQLSETTNELIVTDSDTYFVEVSNSTGCLVKDTVSISFVELPELELGDDVELCEDELFTLEVESNGFNIDWLFNGEVIISGQQTTLDLPETGLYTVRISANDNCFVDDNIRVTYFELPIADLGEDRSACPGEVIDLTTGNTGDTFIWYTDTDGILSENGNTLSVTLTDLYAVTVTSPNNCVNIDSVEITFTELPVLDLGPDISNVCEGDVVTIGSDAGGFTVEWLLDGQLIAEETDDELSVSQSGEYTLIASASANCNISDVVLVNFNEPPDINDLQDQVACNGDNVELIAGADNEFVYIWSDDNGIVQEGNMGSLVVTASATITVEAVDANNCSTIKSSEVTFIDAPTIELQDQSEFCEGTSITLQAVSNVSVVEWYYNNSIITGETETTLEASLPGEYIAVVGSGTQCEDRDTIIVNEISAPELEFISANEICEDALPFEIEIETDNTNTIQWSVDGSIIPNETNPTLSVTQAGNYSVLLSNSSGCETEGAIDLTIEPLSVITLDQVPVLCMGESFTMNADTDASQIEWQLNGSLLTGENNSSLEITESGDYTAVVYNALNCPTSANFSVVFNDLPDSQITASDLTACEGDEIVLSAENNSSNTYQWSIDGSILTGETQNDLSVNASGIIQLLVTNEFGCQSSDEVEVEFFTVPSLDATTEASYCEGDVALLMVQTNATNIIWSLNGQTVGQNTNNISVDEPGIYTLTVSSSAGCSNSETITVIENQNPILDIDDVILCPGEMQEILVESGYDEYNWSGIAATGNEALIVYQQVNVPTTSSASLQVVDSNGCSSMTEFSITMNPELNAEVLSDRINLCAGESANLIATGGLYYEWIDPNGSLSATNISNPIASPDENTTYILNVTDDCPSNIETFEITVSIADLPNVDAGGDTCTLVGSELTLSVTGASQYFWNNDDLIIGSSNRADIVVSLTQDTTFTVTGIDENGCRNSDSVRVCIIEDPLQILTAVTLITPNGDFINDQLEFKGLDAFPDNKLTVFNRWGNVIFKKVGYQNDAVRWDGTRDGQELPADTYYYILEFSNFKIKKSITLLRD